MKWNNSPPQENCTHEFDARILCCSQSHNECRFLQIDTCSPVVHRKYLHDALSFYQLGRLTIDRYCRGYPRPKRKKILSYQKLLSLERFVPCHFNQCFWIALTLCLSMCKCRSTRSGSNSSLSGEISIGDWRRPLLHIFHSGLIRPQNAGPVQVEINTYSIYNNNPVYL